MAYGVVSPPALLDTQRRRQPMGGIPNSRPLPFAAAPGAATPPIGGRPQSRPVQAGRGRPVQRRGRPSVGASPSGAGGPTPQPLIDPMRTTPLGEAVPDFEGAAALSRIPGIGQLGSESSVRRRRHRRPEEHLV